MVRNSGGKNFKKVGRKHVNQVETELKLRLVGSDQELYGIVMKPLGNGQFLIICNDQVERICIIRNKFTGRNKHSNLVSVGSWVIVGLRDWETTKEN
jgi:translation initiation factor IF-1